MLSNLKKISKDLIIYSALVSDFEPMDFKNDALAGVRANYFNSHCNAQNEKTEIYMNDKLLNLSYSMEKGEPLSWKAAYNNRPYQTVKRSSGGIYCVITYNENGFVYKRMYFDLNHTWIRTEYYSDSSNSAESVLYPKMIDGLFVLIYEEFDSLGSKTTLKLFPSTKAPRKKCVGLVYTNSGMIWYDSSFAPDDIEYGEDEGEKNNGFHFQSENFNVERQLHRSRILENADYLTEDDIKSVDLSSEVEQEGENSNKPYSAYDKIESILFEAHKTNKNIFGEIVNHGEAEADLSAETNVDEFEQSETEQADELVLEQDNFEEAGADELAEEMIEVFTGGVNVDEETLEVKKSDEHVDNCDKIDYIPKSDEKSDSVIKTATGEYLYYGKLDENQLRTGRGRTVTPDGLTSFDGEYVSDKRHGFGICYYKEGSVNYVGNWNNGNRSGAGVGYRVSDGTMHAGKWSDNAPQGFGARFDKDGNFLDVCTYVDGKRNGKSVSFDVYGNIVIKYWKDGELISEKIIAD